MFSTRLIKKAFRKLIIQKINTLIKEQLCNLEFIYDLIQKTTKRAEERNNKKASGILDTNNLVCNGITFCSARCGKFADV